MQQIKTIALIGLGAIGCALAPRLQKAVGTKNFRVIAGGTRKTRLETQGVTINGQNYRFNIVTPEEETGPADLVIVIVKYGGLAAAIQDIGRQVGPDTILVSFMNGIDSEELLAVEYGWERVIYGLTRKSVVMKDGCCTYDPQQGWFVFGEARNEQISPRIQTMADLFSRAAIPYKIEPDMIRALWLKFACNISENPSSAILGIPFGAWHVSVHANQLREMAFREVIRIAHYKGINIGEADLLQQRQNLAGVPYANKTSMLQDIENGRTTEIEMLAGAICRIGSELGIPTPVNELFYHSLKVLEEKIFGLIKTSQETVL
jgi:2-dehydropantoate 2-reductase